MSPAPGISPRTIRSRSTWREQRQSEAIRKEEKPATDEHGSNTDKGEKTVCQGRPPRTSSLDLCFIRVHPWLASLLGPDPVEDTRGKLLLRLTSAPSRQPPPSSARSPRARSKPPPPGRRSRLHPA